MSRTRTAAQTKHSWKNCSSWGEKIDCNYICPSKPHVPFRWLSLAGFLQSIADYFHQENLPKAFPASRSRWLISSHLLSCGFPPAAQAEAAVLPREHWILLPLSNFLLFCAPGLHSAPFPGWGKAEIPNERPAEAAGTWSAAASPRAADSDRPEAAKRRAAALAGAAFPERSLFIKNVCHARVIARLVKKGKKNK